MAVVGFYHIIHYIKKLQELTSEDATYVNLAKEAISREFEIATSDLAFLSNFSALNRYLEGVDLDKEKIAQAFLAVVKTKNLYDQARFLDETGQEVVRVNYNAGKHTMVPDSQLQNKGQRYYFLDTFRLERGEVFVSPLDLNVEQGEVERPLKPMIRFGTPVFDGNGIKRGIILLNYLADNMLSRLDKVARREGANHLLNNDGYWLHAPNSDDEWGFMLGTDRHFSTSYPTVWKAMVEREKGMLEDDEGIFTFTTIYPPLEGQLSGPRSDTVFSNTLDKVPTSRYFWKLASHIDPGLLRDRFFGHVCTAAWQV